MATWDRRGLLSELRRRLEHHQQLGRGLTAGLRRAFGSLAAARVAATRARRRATGRDRRRARAIDRRPWTPRRIREALRDPRTDLTDPRLIAACIRHFGSLTAARAAVARSQRRRTWSRATVIAELQARLARGLRGVGRLLRDPAVRLFGSTEAALQAAAQAPRVPRAPPDRNVLR